MGIRNNNNNNLNSAKFDTEMWATSHVFLEGDCPSLNVSGSDFDLIVLQDAELGSGDFNVLWWLSRGKKKEKKKKASEC